MGRDGADSDWLRENGYGFLVEGDIPSDWGGGRVNGARARKNESVTLHSSKNESQPKYFQNFKDACEWAKAVPGRAIVRCPSTDGFMAKDSSSNSYTTSIKSKSPSENRFYRLSSQTVGSIFKEALDRLSPHIRYIYSNANSSFNENRFQNDLINLCDIEIQELVDILLEYVEYERRGIQKSISSSMRRSSADFASCYQFLEMLEKAAAICIGKLNK